MSELPVTPMTYLSEMAATSWQHGRELVAALACAIALVAASIALSAYTLVVLPFAIVAVFLFEAVTAAWRLHRRQHIALATMRSLLDLNAADRLEIEWQSRARHRRREARIHERNDVRIERLAGEIDALQTEAVARFN